MNLSDLQFHELSNLFPLMPEDSKEFLELAADIAQNGLKERITTLNGLILDGRNRYRACRLAGLHLTADDIVILEEEEAFVNEDPFKFVVSKNLHRRHLSTSQRAAVAAEIFKRLSPRKKGTSSIEDVSKEIHQRYEQAARPMQVSPKSVERAVGVLNADPQLYEEVKAGTKTMHQATKEVKRRKQNRKVDDQDKDEAQQKILEICGEKFWSAMMAKKVPGTERVVFADRPAAELRVLAGVMFWGELTVGEALKFRKERFGKKLTKKWKLEDLMALMGEENEYQEGFVTERGCRYRITIERMPETPKKKERSNVLAKEDQNHE